VGSGGFSEVWEARAPDAGPSVAVKLLRPPVTLVARARLEREVEAHALVHHASVCRLERPLLQDDGIVFELLEGPALAERLDAGPLTLREAIPMFCDLFRALDAVRGAGVVHRDVTPANVVLHGPSRAKLIDFGIAKIARDADFTVPKLTGNDTALGSLVHQAPEQIDEPRDVDWRADLYGLGSTIFHALAGRPAFRAPTAAALLVLKSKRSAPTLSEVTGRSWPAPLEALLASLLAREPQARPASGHAAAELLGRFLERS
jgi:serine/threonine-protein kinase